MELNTSRSLWTTLASGCPAKSRSCRAVYAMDLPLLSPIGFTLRPKPKFRVCFLMLIYVIERTGCLQYVYLDLMFTLPECFRRYRASTVLIKRLLKYFCFQSIINRVIGLQIVVSTLYIKNIRYI